MRKLSLPVWGLVSGLACLAQQQAPPRHASMPVATRDGQRIAFWSERADGSAQQRISRF